MKKRSETKFLSPFSYLYTFCWEFWLLKQTTSKIRIFSQRLNVFVLFILSSFILDCFEALENKSATENKDILFINIKRNFKCWKFTIVHVLVGISFCFSFWYSTVFWLDFFVSNYRFLSLFWQFQLYKIRI